MKASYALAVVLGLCRGPTAVVSFLPPPATALAGAKSMAPVAAGPLIASSSVAAGGRGSRLAAAREDCKSCMEAELLEEERKAAAKGGGAEDAATRRVALEEVVCWRAREYFSQVEVSPPPHVGTCCVCARSMLLGRAVLKTLTRPSL